MSCPLTLSNSWESAFLQQGEREGKILRDSSDRFPFPTQGCGETGLDLLKCTTTSNTIAALSKEFPYPIRQKWLLYTFTRNLKQRIRLVPFIPKMIAQLLTKNSERLKG